MSFPEGFSTSEEYFAEALRFLKDFSWIYVHPNTHILVESTLKRIPSEWITHFKGLSNDEFNRFHFAQDSHNISQCPDSLKQFLSKIESLDVGKYETNKIHEAGNESGCSFQLYQLPKDFNKKGLSLKKQHEIERLVPLIDSHCKKHGINIVIDVGSGLGYLSQLLFRRGEYKVLGIEADLNKLEAAWRRQRDFFPDSSNCVKYIQHFVTEDSGREILKFVEESFSIGLEDDSQVKASSPNLTVRPEHDDKIVSKFQIKICITGLHACADLSISILKIFAEIKELSCMIAMPCCYHRMRLKGTLTETEKTTENMDKIPSDAFHISENETFHNFPASKCLRRVYENTGGNSFLKRPFLRLACQQTRGVWQGTTYSKHVKHAEDVTRRAVLQLVAEKENYELSRVKRKTKLQHQPPTTKSSSAASTFKTEDSFELYLKALETTHSLRARTNFEAVATDCRQPSCSSTSSLKTFAPIPGEIRPLSNQAPCEENDKQSPPATISCEENLVDSDRFKGRMRQEWSRVKDTLFHAEYLSLLQVLLQSVCENVVLLDRIELLKELLAEVSNVDVESCGYVKVMDDTLSPRCRALVACKGNGRTC